MPTKLAAGKQRAAQPTVEMAMYWTAITPRLAPSEFGAHCRLREDCGTIDMGELRADVTTAFENPIGVIFHVEMPGRRMMAQISCASLVGLGSGQAPGELSKFVQENQPAMQRLVDEGVESGWKGPLELMV